MTAKNNPFERYTITSQTRYYQRGIHKGEIYTVNKLFDTKEKKFVKHAQVMKEAKIVYKKPYASKGVKHEQRTRIDHKLLIKNYKRKKDSSYGKAGTIAPSIIHYRTEMSSGIKSDVDAFAYKKAQLSRDKIPLDYLYPSADRSRRSYYGDAKIEIIETTYE